MKKERFLNLFFIILIGVLVVVGSVQAATTIGLNIETAGTISFNGSTSGTVTLQPASVAGTYSLTLPTDDGTSNQVLTTDGSGVLTWSTPSSGATNSAGANVIAKSNGTNLVASQITDDGTTVNIGTTTSTKVLLSGVKVYRALLSQTGTNAPVATVLENSLGGTVVWTYVAAGRYLGTLSGAFPIGKTIAKLTVDGNANGYYGFLTHEDVNTVKTYVFDTVTNNVEMGVGESIIEILVYP